MGLTRREFFRVTGAARRIDRRCSDFAQAKEKPFKLENATKTNTICPYCSVAAAW